MNHSNAVDLWNACCCIAYEGHAQVTHFGTAALASGLQTWINPISDYYFAHPDLCRKDLEPNASIAAWLREWADAIERKASEGRE